MASGLAETAAGLALLFVPNIVLVLLLGLTSAATETLLVGRVAGSALLAIGVACWLARNDARTPTQAGLLGGILIYNLAVTILLGWAGAVLAMTGICLWPGVALHAALAAWCCVVVASKRGSGDRGKA